MAEYIEREKVLSMSYCTNNPTWDNPHLDPKSVVDVDDIEALPTADVVQVRHGEWSKTDWSGVSVNGYMVCTQCNVMIPKCEYNRYCLSYLKYCPNCGAKMEGVKNE